MNVSGMSNPTIMFVEHGSGRVLGPSLPIKASGKPGWQGKPAWVKYENGEYKEIKDGKEVRKAVENRRKVLARLGT